jgi:AcrR family transcriptional regulator
VASDETRDRLIAAAERLFAKEGFDGVTMKQNTTEAGQRNVSALHYHFGSKWALVAAIVARRMPALNARRDELLDEVERSGRTGEIRVVVEAMIRPVAELLDAREEGRYWMPFLLQVWSNPRSRLAEVVPAEFNSSVVRGGSLLALSMTHLPARIVQQRLSMLTGLVIQALGDYHRFGAGDGPPRGRLSPVFFEGLIDIVTAMLTAPVSAPTNEALDDDDRAI